MGQNNRNKFASNQVTLKICDVIGQSASTSFCFPFHSCLCPPCLAISHTRIATGPHPIIPSQKWILKQQGEYNSTSQSTARKSAANVRTPSVTSSEPLPKRPENLSGATAVVFLGCVHLGRRRDQLLDHGSVAFQSRLMQRRLASGAEDATRKAGLLRHRGETKRSNGMFSPGGWANIFG